MRGLQPVHRVGRPQLAGLHDKSEQACRQTQEEERIAQALLDGRRHRLDGTSEGII
jgi:hypothetical protein